MTTDLTDRQRAILTFISDSIRDEGYPPTVREIRKAFAYKSLNAVICHLEAIESKGYIKRVKGSPRAITVTSPADRVIEGAAVAADNPYTAEDITEALKPDEVGGDIRSCGICARTYEAPPSETLCHFCRRWLDTVEAVRGASVKNVPPWFHGAVSKERTP